MHLSYSSLTIQTFEELGVIPNIEKSQLKPVQKIMSSWLFWVSVNYCVSVPPENLADVQNKCLCAPSSRVSITFLSAILGSIEFLDGVSHMLLFIRDLQHCYFLFK